MDPTIRVAVVGGGIAGLAAAWQLRRRAVAGGRGVEVRLVEAEERLGGRIASERRDGFLVEAGPDSFVVRKPAAVELAGEVELGERLVGTRPEHQRVWLLRRGRLVEVPPGMGIVPCRLAPVFASEILSWRGKLRLSLDLVLPRRRRTGDESLGAFLRRRFGREAVEGFAGPLMAGIYSADPETLSLQATFPHFAAIERHRGSLIRGLRDAGDTGSPTSARVAPAGGMGELVEALVAALGDGGGEGDAVTLTRGRRVVRLERVPEGAGTQAPVRETATAGLAGEAAHAGTRLLGGEPWPGLAPEAGDEPRRERRGAGWRGGGESASPRSDTAPARDAGAGRAATAGGHVCCGSAAAHWRLVLDDGDAFCADAVILALPAFAAAALTAPFAPRLAAGLAAIDYVSTATVTIAFREADLPRPLDGYGFVVPAAEGRRITAVTFSSAKFPGRAPAGGALMRVFLGGPGGAALLDRDDADLVAVAREELASIWGLAASPRFALLHRHPRATPRYDVGHRDRVAALHALLPPTLHLAGAAYHGLGIPDCITSGRQAADAALSAP